MNCKKIIYRRVRFRKGTNNIWLAGEMWIKLSRIDILFVYLITAQMHLWRQSQNLFIELNLTKTLRIWQHKWHRNRSLLSSRLSMLSPCGRSALINHRMFLSISYISLCLIKTRKLAGDFKVDGFNLRN